MNVLLVEDDPVTRAGWATRLRIEGHTVCHCSDGLSAASAIRGGFAADIILLDLMMPGAPGVKVMENLKELTAAPILVTTAAPLDDLPAGTSAIQKPFGMQELRAAMEAALATKQGE